MPSAELAGSFAAATTDPRPLRLEQGGGARRDVVLHAREVPCDACGGRDPHRVVNDVGVVSTRLETDE